MRLGLAGCGAVVLFVVLCACGDSPSAPSASESEAAGGGAGQGSGGGAAGGEAGHPCTDVQSDPYNCGACGVACSFASATPLCVSGTCARGVCSSGWHDLDADPTNGCEASCSGASCTVGTGAEARTVTLSAPPLPESGGVASAFSNSGPVGAGAEDPPPVDLSGILGDPTPLAHHDGDLDNPTDAFVSNQNPLIENLIGYQAVLH